MAKIHKDTVTITISRIVKSNTKLKNIEFPADFAENLENVVEELLGEDGAIVEVATSRDADADPE